jgi:hypothetical protein
MATKKKQAASPLPGLVLPVSRSSRVIFRLTDDGDASLRELARKAGLGPSTLARLIVEKYLSDHSPKKA